MSEFENLSLFAFKNYKNTLFTGSSKSQASCETASKLVFLKKNTKMHFKQKLKSTKV